MEIEVDVQVEIGGCAGEFLRPQEVAMVLQAEEFVRLMHELYCGTA